MEEKIYIFWVNLIKEVELKDWTKKYYSKIVLDEDMRSELLYWWVEIRQYDNLEDIKKNLK